MRARIYDRIMRQYPGYTLSTLDAEDAGELLPMITLLDAVSGDG